MTISVRLPAATARALDEACRSTDRPRSYFILKALDSYLSEQAEYRVALDRLMDKNDPILSSSELKKRLGRKGR
jgi:RHH-type transcriptional regulator, rel operon repressor / antitoxin RelB